MKPDDPKLDPPLADPEPSPGKIPAWARAPIFMYMTMVAAFAVLAVFVVYHVIRMTQLAR